MKYYLIVGEASGDLHASRLMRSLKKIDEFAEFRFFGGDLMAAEWPMVPTRIAGRTVSAFFRKSDMIKE